MDGWVGSGDHASRVVEFGLGATRVSTGIGRGAGGMMGGTEMKVPISGTGDSLHCQILVGNCPSPVNGAF